MEIREEMQILFGLQNFSIHPSQTYRGSTQFQGKWISHNAIKEKRLSEKIRENYIWGKRIRENTIKEKGLAKIGGNPTRAIPFKQVQKIKQRDDENEQLTGRAPIEPPQTKYPLAMGLVRFSIPGEKRKDKEIRTLKNVTELILSPT